MTHDWSHTSWSVEPNRGAFYSAQTKTRTMFWKTLLIKTVQLLWSDCSNGPWKRGTADKKIFRDSVLDLLTWFPEVDFFILKNSQKRILRFLIAMKLLYLAQATSFQILVVVATLARSEIQVTDSTEKELLAEIKSVPVSGCFVLVFWLSIVWYGLTQLVILNIALLKRNRSIFDLVWFNYRFYYQVS